MSGHDHMVIGPFEIDKELGVGGMGIVYRAVYTKANKRVALKLLTESVATKPKLLARFERECDILKKLNHPNIVRYYGGGVYKGKHFYAMEYMDAGSLEQRMKRKGKLKWNQAIEVAKQVCAGLDHAHRHNVIHRDLKPGNLFLTKRGRLKLGDFGIAKDEDESGLTSDGKTVGTYAYMAPEQIVGKPPVSGRTDIYALGAVLYELMTGETPFDAETPVDILFQHLEKEPPKLRDKVPDCPQWVEDYLLKCLAKKPEDRFQNAREMYEGLKKHMQGGDDDSSESAAVPAAVQTNEETVDADGASNAGSVMASDTAPEQRSSALGGDTALEPSSDGIVQPRLGADLEETTDGLSANTDAPGDEDAGMRFQTAETQVVQPRHPDVFPDQAAEAEDESPAPELESDDTDSAAEEGPEDSEVATKAAGEVHTGGIDIKEVLGKKAAAPFYKSTWFIAVCVVAVLGIGGLVAFLAQG